MDNQQADKKKLVNENQALIYPDITAICHVSNLEWVTNEENKQHAVENNLLKTEKNRLANTGSRNNGAKLTEEQVLDIRSRPYDLDKLSKEFNVSKNTIWGIFARRNWTHI